MEPETWKSPRRVEEEIKQYQRCRFEAYMRMADDGTITRELGIDEMESGLWTPHGKEAPSENNQVA